MASRYGIDGQLFYQTDGVSGSAGWNENDIIGDLTLNLSTEEVDDTVRASGGWKSTKGKLKDAELTFDMRDDPDSAHYAAFRDAYHASTHLGLRVYNGDASDGDGFEADFVITGFEHGQNKSEVQMVSVTMKVTYVDTAPIWNEAA